MNKLLLFLIITLTLSACNGAQSPISTTAGNIVCEVFYRSGAGQSFESAPLMKFTGGTEKQSQAFDELLFEAWFQDDEFEGRALSIVIVDSEKDREIARQLYQFDPQNSVENQFVGGHGFTGLNYVFHPNSVAEIQYFCSVD
jgi:hypothetical protein